MLPRLSTSWIVNMIIASQRRCLVPCAAVSLSLPQAYMYGMQKVSVTDLSLSTWTCIHDHIIMMIMHHHTAMSTGNNGEKWNSQCVVEHGNSISTWWATPGFQQLAIPAYDLTRRQPIAACTALRTDSVDNSFGQSSRSPHTQVINFRSAAHQRVDPHLLASLLLLLQLHNRIF